MKPDWKDAPDWAKYLAQDSGSNWWWYAEKPRADYRNEEFVGGGKCEIAYDARISEWESTLEPRP